MCIDIQSFIISVKAGNLHVVGCHLGAGIEKGQCPSAISGCESHAGIHRQVLECRIKFITGIVDCEICVRVLIKERGL